MYGISVYRPNGNLVMTDALPGYKFLFKTTAGSFTVASDAPPLIFSRTESSTATSIRYPTITKNAPGSWNCSVGRFSSQMRSDADVLATGEITSYVFGTNTAVPSGYGIALGGFVMGSTTNNLPLLIKATPKVDPNGPQLALAGYSRTVALPLARGSWAGLISPGVDAVVKSFNLTGQSFYFTNNQSIAGIPTHWWLPTPTSISSLGGTIQYVDGTQMTNPMTVWLIDTFLYD